MPGPRLLVDTGPLIALLNRRDKYHAAISNFLSSYHGELLTTWSVLTEVTHQVPPHRAVRFMELVKAGYLAVIDMAGAEARVHQLMEKYADRPMDLADATLVWAAEKTGIAQVLTIDADDFATYRLSSGKKLEILP